MIEKRGEQWCIGAVCYPTEAEARAAMAKHNSIKDVEVFSVGKHKGDTYTEADLDAMVTAFATQGFTPPLKLGHTGEVGAPAVGWVENLRREGRKLIADFVNLPQAVYDAVKGRLYDRVSSEIYWNLEAGGKKFRRALKAVALLGAEIPAVTGLKPLHQMFTGLRGDVHIYDDEQEVIMTTEDTKVVEMTAKLADAEKKLLASGTEETRLKTEVKSLADQIAAQAEKDSAARAVAYAATVKLPAIRPHLTALYALAQSQPKTVKFSIKDGQSEEIAPTAIVEKLTDTINKLAEKYLSKQELSGEKQERLEDAVNEGDAGAQVHAKVIAYCKDQKLDQVKDYQKALHAVLDAEPELKKQYAA